MFFLVFAFLGVPAILNYLGLGLLAVIYALVVIPFWLIKSSGESYKETALILLAIWIFYYLVS